MNASTNREGIMFTLIVVPTILILVAVSVISRLIFRPLWNPYRLRRPYYGPYGYYGYGRGYRRHWFPGGFSNDYDAGRSGPHLRAALVIAMRTRLSASASLRKEIHHGTTGTRRNALTGEYQ